MRTWACLACRCCDGSGGIVLTCAAGHEHSMECPTCNGDGVAETLITYSIDPGERGFRERGVQMTPDIPRSVEVESATQGGYEVELSDDETADLLDDVGEEPEGDLR